MVILAWIKSKGVFLKIQNGTGDNLSREDIKNGYVDYVLWSIFRPVELEVDQEFGMDFKDGGMFMAKKPITLRLSIKDCIEQAFGERQLSDDVEILLDESADNEDSITKNAINSRLETPGEAAALFRAELPKNQKEERVYVLPLDANGKILSKPILVAVGHQDGTAAIDAGAIFREVLAARAEEMIVAHNHPSGDLTPSKADIAATIELKDLASRLSVTFLDHLIIGAPDSAGGRGYVSIMECE